MKSDKFTFAAVSNIGGATNYIDEKSLTVLPYYLNDGKSKVDMLIIMGGLFPYLPKRGSVISNDYLKLIKPNLNTIDDLSVYMKPFMERIANYIPKDTKLAYVFGDEDYKNIKIIVSELSLHEKEGNTEAIEQLIKNENFIIKSRENIIDNSVNEIKIGEEKRRNIKNNTEENKKLTQELDKKLEKNRYDQQEAVEEKNRANDRLVLLNKIYTYLINSKYSSCYADKLDEEIKKKEDNIKEINDKVNNFDKDKNGDGLKEFINMTSEKKALENSIKILINKRKDLGDSNLDSKQNIENKRINRFSGNYLTNKTLQTLTDELANLYYLENVKRTFGVKHKVDIQEDKIKLETVSVGSKKYNVYTTYNQDLVLGSYKNNSTNWMKINSGINYSKINFSNLSNKINKNRDAIIISGKATESFYSIKPKNNESEYLNHELTIPPFFDKGKLEDIKNKGVNTPITKALQNNEPVTTGLTIFTLNKNDPANFRFVESDELVRNYYNLIKKQLPLLKNKVKELEKRNDIKPTHEGADETIEKFVALAKFPPLPSDDSWDYEIKKYGKDIIKKWEKDISEISKEIDDDGEEKKLKIGVITDQHIGNHPIPYLLDRAAEALSKENLDVLVFTGDNIDGAYDNHASEPRQEDSEPYKQKVIEMLRKEDKTGKLVNKYLKSKNNDFISNIDEQDGFFYNPVKDLVFSVAKRGKGIVMVSGNHFNKAGKKSPGHRDEATRLYNDINISLEGLIEGDEDSKNKIKDQLKNAGLPESKINNIIKGLNEEIGKIKKTKDNLSIISGGDFGAGYENINGLDFQFTHEMFNPEKYLKSKLKGKPDVTVSGHTHSAEIHMLGDQVFLQTPSGQNPYSSFMNSSSIPIGKGDGTIAGVGVFTIKYNKNKILSIDSKYYLYRHLLRPDEKRINEIVEKVKSMNV